MFIRIGGITVETAEIQSDAGRDCLQAVIGFVAFMVGAVTEAIACPQAGDAVEAVFGTCPEVMCGTQVSFDVRIFNVVIIVPIVILSVLVTGVGVFYKFGVRMSQSMLYG